MARFAETTLRGNRPSVVKQGWAIVMATALALIGCGGTGTGTEKTGTVSGFATDAAGAVVRNARVFYRSSSEHFTFTNASGAYTLEEVPEGTRKIQAEVTVNGVRYFGENFVDVFANERTKSANLIMSRADRTATVTGIVRDRDRNPLEFVRIYFNLNNLGSKMAITDEDGEFTAGGFPPDVDIEVSATGRGYNADETTLRLNASERRRVDFTLDFGTNPNLPVPQNLTAVAWTSTRVGTTLNTARPESAGSREALRAFFDRHNGKSRARHTMGKGRDTVAGNWIEVDLEWEPVRNPGHIGYGIYRGTSAGGTTRGIEFLRDTLTSFFADADSSLAENQQYFYEITALNTQYPDTNESESNFSNRYGVLTLGDQRVSGYNLNNQTFSWSRATGATHATVFVFDRYPDFGVLPVWPREGNQAEFDRATSTGTSLVYGGPALTRGRTYYWLVLGWANNLDSRTISTVRSFVAP